MKATLDGRIEDLRQRLREMERVVVCFSGGVDSAYLLAEAVAVLGEGALALTAVSPSLAPDERTDAEALARRLGARHLLVDTQEMADPRYTANDTDRCYWCKTSLYEAAVSEALALGVPHVLDGFNRDDRADHRPGRQAAREKGVRSPLDEAGLTKADVREGAQRLGLEVWDKPALACLASRLPYGTEVTPERLRQVWEAESALRDLGFRILRVRHHGEVARIELGDAEVGRFLDPGIRAEVNARLLAAGFRFVALDLVPYRTGRLNEGVVSPKG